MRQFHKAASASDEEVWEDRRRRVAKILPILKRLYPDARCSLDFTNPLELAVATILSAQCTDARVNIVTKNLFAKYRSAEDYARADLAQLEKDIQSTGFYRNKARNIHALAQILVSDYQGKVPDTMEALVALPGIGRKTANVILGNAFGKKVGIAVDTHVIRLSNRLGLTDHATDAVKIERDLMRIVPQKEWTLWSHLLIYHGRKVCTARNPDCANCPLLPYCPGGQAIMAQRAAGVSGE